MAEETPTSGTDMLLDGAAATQCVDSSGEIVDIEGVDCSTFHDEDGGILVNYEHASREEGPETIIGKVVYYKKIFKESDCENDRQKKYWEKCRKNPYIYVIVRLFNGSGHTAAMAAAAIVRDNVAHGEPLMTRWSIEGATLKKDGLWIRRSIWKALALTCAPCNKTAYSGLLSDPKSDSFDAIAKSERRIGGAVEVECDPVVSADILAKAMSAGCGDAAPSTLTGGAAMQREDVAGTMKRALRDWGTREFKREEFRAFCKAKLPEASDEFLDHFTDVAERIADGELKKTESEPEISPLSALQEQVMAWEEELVDLRKTVDEVVNGPRLPIPDVHRVQLKIGDRMHPAGRFMVQDGNVVHLEDYHGLLSTMMPEGPLDPNVLARLGGGSIQVSGHPMGIAPLPMQQHSANGGEVEVVGDPAPPRAAVFAYHRPGYHRPHVLEFGPAGAALDGRALDESEVGLLLSNVQSGLASVRYHDVAGLAKAEHDYDPGDAVDNLRRILGNDHPDVKVLARHIHEDPMVPGMGNKYSFMKHRNKVEAEGRPGVWVSMDGNSFKSLNDTHGHAAGDQAISGLGGALRDAGAAVGGGKVFRAGGDEFVAHFPSMEHAARFAREARSRIDSIPPVVEPGARGQGGINEGKVGDIRQSHKLSMSFGFGNDYPTADRALYAAKAGKKDPVTGQAAFPPGRTPHFAHSLVDGAIGPVPLHSETPPSEHLPSSANRQSPSKAA
jgi:diguanylate cyclase (GGDEF)-like protein